MRGVFLAASALAEPVAHETVVGFGVVDWIASLTTMISPL
jgi:hypothetical protein